MLLVWGISLIAGSESSNDDISPESSSDWKGAGSFLLTAFLSNWKRFDIVLFCFVEDPVLKNAFVQQYDSRLIREVALKRVVV